MWEHIVARINNVQSGIDHKLDISTDTTIIPDNSDLNTYIEPGTYCVQYAANAQTIVNSPTTSVGYRLIVTGAQASHMRYQVALCYEGEIYIRFCTNTANASTASAWTEWSRVYTEEIVDAQIVTASSSTGAAYTATVPEMRKLNTGTRIVMIPSVVSTTTQPTLAINSFGTKRICRRVSKGGTGYADGYNASWLAANKPIPLYYDGTYWIAEDLTKPDAVDLNGTVSIPHGGTGATDAPGARANLGAASQADLDSYQENGQNMIPYSKDLPTTQSGSSSFGSSPVNQYWIGLGPQTITIGADGFSQSNFELTGRTSAGWPSFTTPVYRLPDGWQNRKVVLSAWLYSDDWSILDEGMYWAIKFSPDGSRTQTFDRTPQILLAGGALSGNARGETPTNGKWTRVWTILDLAENKLINLGSGVYNNLTHVWISFAVVKNGVVSIKKPKLEFGTVPTAWSPAYEDIENKVNQFSTETWTFTLADDTVVQKNIVLA